MDSKRGAPRKFDYEGKKKITSIRLSKKEKILIYDNFGSIGEFIQWALKKLKE